MKYDIVIKQRILLADHKQMWIKYGGNTLEWGWDITHLEEI